MFTDPYEVLGVARDASMDDIKKAYRRLSRIYHPDANVNNPNKDQAEEKFKDIQAAYQQIVHEREHGGSSSGYGSSSYGSGSSRGYYNQGQYQQNTGSGYDSNSGYDEQSGYGYYGPFEDFFGSFWGSQSGSYQNAGSRSYSDDPETDNHLRAAANYITNRCYGEALNVLNEMNDRPAQWYYLSAIANRGVGNTVTALEHARQAVSMDSSNYQYRALLDQLQNGGQWYTSAGQQYGTGGMSAGRWCLQLFLLNLFCNMCLGGYGCMGGGYGGGFRM